MAEFVERFERPRIPVVITGLAEHWPATRRWTDPEDMRRRFGDHKFKVRGRVGRWQEGG